MNNYISQYLNESVSVIEKLDKDSILNILQILVRVKNDGGRIFFLGVGGSAANASHAVNDFRKIAGIECYAPTDNVSELTARTNDDGWASVFVNWLEGSKLCNKDCIFILSVGGGNAEKNISPNLIQAVDYALKKNAAICGIVGKDGGYTAKKADACVIIPVVNEESITPHSEAFQSVILHMLVSHPSLKSFGMKWESVK